MSARTVKAVPRTLHQRIRSDIERRILSGKWRPGQRIPIEQDIMAQYGCARMTANRAIASLVHAGLVVRRRRAGSFVAQPRAQSAILEIPDIQADVVARGGEYQLRLVSRRKRKAVARRDDEKTLAAGGELLALRCVHMENGRPFALEERLISLAAVPQAQEVDFTIESPGAWLLHHVPWTQAEHRITAVNADGDTASILEVGLNTACLAVERRTWRGVEAITQVRNVFPGTAYALIGRFAARAN
jgi:GntR family histidine utilization transcriptional repressor